MNTRHERETFAQHCANSARWAAWGDALGFISELTDAAGLRRRLGSMELRDPVAWKRRVGGRSGVSVELPAGCYSDDTQLRLAVGRSINIRGFDPETFAKVELPTWTNYALGGGRATKAAAANLASTAVPWFGNFHTGWTSAGGNGAAMRIQPHIWAAQRPAEPGRHIADLMIDASVTHGHPRALLGAALCGFALGHTLQFEEVPSLAQWPELLRLAIDARQVFYQHPELSTVWEPHWRKESGQDFNAAWKLVGEEVESMMSLAAECVANPAENRDAGVVLSRLADVLDLRSVETRGSATSTVVAALAISHAYHHEPAEGIRATARTVGIDTDTIATMAGAIIGAQTLTRPPSPVLDEEYIVGEAGRLARLSDPDGVSRDSFNYPDLLHWSPPTTQADAIRLVSGESELLGLGRIAMSETAGQSGSFVWSWGRLTFGQTVIVKHRIQVAESMAKKTVEQQEIVYEQTPIPVIAAGGDKPRSPSEVTAARSPSWGSGQSILLDVDQIITWVGAQNFSDNSIGYAVRRLSEQGTVEQLIAFLMVIRKDVARLRRGNGRQSGG